MSSKISVERLLSIRQGFVSSLKANGFHSIGEGGYATVYGRKNTDYVYKVGRYDPDDRDLWLDYAALVMSRFQDNPHAPKIFKVKDFGPFYIAKMERLTTTVKFSVNEVAKTLCEDVGKCLWLSSPDSVWYKLENEMPALAELVEAIVTLGGANDMCEENAMLRYDGTFVITDPIY